MLQSEIYARLRQHGSAWLNTHVLYADRQLVVLNKPPGLICQTSNVSKNHDMHLNLHLKYMQHWLSSEPRSVHRLDKGTTGCFLVAAHQTAARAISQQFRLGTVRKTYLALVHGGPLQNQSGRITNCIKYFDGRGVVHIDGRRAVTEWKLLATSAIAPLSLISLDLLTGCKHQLRLHLATCLNTPILGDQLYSPSNLSLTKLPVDVPEGRMFLHASNISLIKYLQSGLKFRLNVQAPLPSDFIKICHESGIVIPPGLEKENLSITGTRLPEHPELLELRLSSSYFSQQDQ